jgi:small-conductance mechanosensitive channel
MRNESPLFTAGVLAVAVALLAALLAMLTRVLHPRLVRATSHTRTSIDDLLVFVLHRTTISAAVFIVCLLAPQLMELPRGWAGPMRIVAVAALALQLAVWANAAVTFTVRRVSAQADTVSTAATLMSAMSLVIRLAVISIVVVLALANLGVDVSTVVAGLGIGGVAVALAVQSVLKDVLGTLSIIINKPFVVGDVIEVDEYLGSVKSIRMRCTQLENLPGEELSIPNQKILEGAIRNHSRMKRRRVSFPLRVHHETRAAELDAIDEILGGAVAGVPDTQFERAYLKRATPAGFDFEIVYYVESADYDVYAARHHDITIGMMRRFEARGVRLGIPLAGREASMPE